MAKVTNSIILPLRSSFSNFQIRQLIKNIEYLTYLINRLIISKIIRILSFGFLLYFSQNPDFFKIRHDDVSISEPFILYYSLPTTVKILNINGGDNNINITL